MYKLSLELSKIFDIFCNIARKIVKITTLRTMLKPLVPAALLLAHHKAKLTTRNNLIVSDIVTLQSLAIKLNTLHIAALLALAITEYAEYATLNIKLSLVNHRHTKNILASSWLNRVEAESCHNIPSRHLTYILIA